jgi:RimJ/RimL family protein N-acetyltransferase
VSTSGRARATGSIRVRRATLGDLDAIVSLRRELRHEERGVTSGSTFDDDRDLRQLTTRQLRHRGQLFLVAVRETQIVGMIRLVAPHRLDAPGVVLLTTAYVVQSQRRRGVMRRLVRAALTWSASLGASEIRLRVSAGNASGNAAWQALGFETVQLLRRRVVPPVERR